MAELIEQNKRNGKIPGQIPHELAVRGLCLYSTATQLPGDTALASSHDTSRESKDSTGHSDKMPVLPHRGRTLCEKGALLDAYAVLPWPWEPLCSTHQEPNWQLGRAFREPSLPVSLRTFANHGWTNNRVP